MKSSFLVYAALVFWSTGCKRQPILSFNHSTSKQIIAIQPLDNYEVSALDAVIEDISKFYNKRIIILPAIAIPANFYNTSIKQYAADSILKSLSKLHNDTLVAIIGITHQPLFTIKNAQPLPFFDINILGLGYQPGIACVVSDQRFATINSTAFSHIMKNIIIHEVGHNLGLSHCPDTQCIMWENNGDILTLGNTNGNYCNKCRTKLK